MKQIAAIQKFLKDQPYELAQLYTPEMEVQVNVAKDNGESITGNYAGHRWQGYTDGLTTWKSFRIPWNAAHDPKYTDKEIKFDLFKHVEAIGMTGWNWVLKRSEWFGFDFDTLIDHKEGLDGPALQNIINVLEEIKWVTLYTSTGSFGLHMYIHCCIHDIISHTEHTAVAKALLDKLSTITRITLQAKVDTFGGNMWVWHRKAIPEKSYRCLKQGEPLLEVPSNWKDYLHLVNSKKVKVRPITDIDQLAHSQNQIKLTEEHLRLLQWFENSTALWWYNEDKQMLVCHTFNLKKAHEQLQLKGIFNTIATGKDKDNDQNCYCFPINDGGWIFRRHTRGVSEASNWFTDSSGWTTCYYNRLPSLRIASRTMGGIEGEKDYSFKTLEESNKVLYMMGIEQIFDTIVQTRSTTIKQTPDNKIIVSVDRHEEELEGWVKKKNTWQKVLYQSETQEEITLPDNVLRHVTINQADLGWFINTNNQWVHEPVNNIRATLIALGYKKAELDFLIGQCILNNWKIVNEPFKLEYLGNRQWNKNAAQFKYDAEEGSCSYWDLILQHCGESLNDACLQNEWCTNNGITTGFLYLLSWISSCFQFPMEPLPYLFFYGPQNSGKSIFHEALSYLFYPGCTRCDHALVNSSGFNAELATAVLCVIEETNLSKQSLASDRIKDWVTGQTLSIHKKGQTPYEINNCTHWIQCANNPSYCPVFPGDTRIVVIKVGSLFKEIPKNILLEQIRKEASAFIFKITQFILPSNPGRLRIPIITTEEKIEQESINRSALEIFIEEKIHDAQGHHIFFREFFQHFHQWLEPEERIFWTKRRLSQSLPFIKGKIDGTGQMTIGNISFEKQEKETKSLKLSNGRLISN